jgi:hypothetical protein
VSSKNGIIDPTDSVVLMVDHQSGLLQVVKDLSVAELRINVAALIKAATLANVPVVATASVHEGPNGPLLPEITDNAPHAVYVQRQGNQRLGCRGLPPGRRGHWSQDAGDRGHHGEYLRR